MFCLGRNFSSCGRNCQNCPTSVGWQEQKVLFERVVVASARSTFSSCGRNWNLKNLERRKKGNYCHKRRYRQNVLTWYRPNHPTFRPQESWFDHCHPTGVRRAVGNFGHKRKKVALAVIDFGQGKKCRFSWIFFLQEESWPKISKIWFTHVNFFLFSHVDDEPGNA